MERNLSEAKRWRRRLVAVAPRPVVTRVQVRLAGCRASRAVGTAWRVHVRRVAGLGT